MDLIDKFVRLSIRRGSPLESLGKNPEDLNVVLLAFLSTTQTDGQPTLEEAERFLSSAGDWISAKPEELLRAAENYGKEAGIKFDLSALTDAVTSAREKLRSEKRRAALKREEELKLERLDRSKDDFFMREALAEARLAYDADEAPIGAVVVDPRGNIIGRAHNHVMREQDPCGHAEVLALREACK